MLVAKYNPEQVGDLLKQVGEEVEIDSHKLDAAADIQSRLDKLRGIAKTDGTPKDVGLNVSSILWKINSDISFRR